MDINYILRREQVSLHNALIASSVPARMAHEALAEAYGALLVKSGFPHRSRKERLASFEKPVAITDRGSGATTSRDDDRPVARPVANDG